MEENPIEELKRRTGQQDDSENTLDEDASTNSFLDLSSSSGGKTQSNSGGQQKKEPEVKPKTQGKQLKPNPYEERFHSEFCFISLVLGLNS